MDVVVFEDRHLREAILTGEAERARAPTAAAACFDDASGRIVVDFTNGAAFMVPARAIQGLENATAAQLAEVELLGETGLHWETLDVDFTIAGLINGIFGTAEFMDAQRRGVGLDLRPRSRQAAPTVPRADAPGRSVKPAAWSGRGCFRWDSHRAPDRASDQSSRWALVNTTPHLGWCER